MLKVFLTLLVLMLTFASGAYAQTYADVNNSGSVNVSDVWFMLEEHLGNTVVPVGKGDCDNRQGYNAGDARYIMDYIFAGGPTPLCPPFPAYTLVSTNDTLYLPSYAVPAGTGQFSVPVIVVNHTKLYDLVLPMVVSGLGSSIFVDSFHWSLPAGGIEKDTAYGNTVVVCYSVDAYPFDLAPGTHLLGEIYFHYVSSPGGTVSMDTVTLRPHTFLNYVYATGPTGYSKSVGIPTVVASVGTFPQMLVQPDTLFFETLAGYPNPTPQQVSILSDGGVFNWTLTKTSWINVSASSGVSGQTIDVTPNISGMAVGTYSGDITIVSGQAIGSPKRVVVKLTLRPQFPSLDANCDGAFNIADIVAELNYIFGYGNLCNPCTGEWLKSK